MTTETKLGWRGDHWREFEHPEDHAERVEVAEEMAARLFADATKKQKAAFDRVMAETRGFIGIPKYDRARQLAGEAWDRDTKEARELMEVTAEHVFINGGECLPEMYDEWESLEKRDAVREAMAEVA